MTPYQDVEDAIKQLYVACVVHGEPIQNLWNLDMKLRDRMEFAMEHGDIAEMASPCVNDGTVNHLEVDDD